MGSGSKTTRSRVRSLVLESQRGFALPELDSRPPPVRRPQLLEDTRGHKARKALPDQHCKAGHQPTGRARGDAAARGSLSFPICSRPDLLWSRAGQEREAGQAESGRGTLGCPSHPFHSAHRRGWHGQGSPAEDRGPNMAWPHQSSPATTVQPSASEATAATTTGSTCPRARRGHSSSHHSAPVSSSVSHVGTAPMWP